MKKFILSIIVILLAILLVKNIYVSNKCIDINYAVENYFTTGIFNKYKLCNMENIDLSFSNGKIAFVKVEGMSSKTPHREMKYTVSLEKNSKGTWKVKKIYPQEITSQ
ncbi:hypothetical protein ACJDU8_04880 [Clostridium sp. WILCCON 0269]|uniref:DUF4878 domain-containing protein n=1 Tax=Candidatus Clostridium eludens TaxID=3381663 RepID=A0ABW8SHU1_9CLOT